MKGLFKKIDQTARENVFFRQVLETGQHTQIVVMSIPPGGDIGEEVHPDTDQILYFTQGTGEAFLEGEVSPISEGDIVLVHAGITHNFENTGSEDLKIISTYSPPHHPPGTIHKTKEEAEQANY